MGCLGSVRRRLKHLLKEGTSVKACTANKSKLSNIMQAKLAEELLTLDAAAARRRTQKASKQNSVKDMKLSDRPRKQQTLSKYTKSKDKLDMEYCRMLAVTACNTGLLPPSLSPISTIHSFCSKTFTHFVASFFSTDFMESKFAASFFATLNFDVSSRRTVMVPLLDALYNDTKKKVLAMCKWKDADSLCTITMDAWVSPIG